MPAIDISGCCIPAECDNIKLPYNGEIASRWDANLLCDICRHFASLISHNLRCIPAYAHQIPTGFFQSLLNYHRDNLYHFLILYPKPPYTQLFKTNTIKGTVLMVLFGDRIRMGIWGNWGGDLVGNLRGEFGVMWWGKNLWILGL